MPGAVIVADQPLGAGAGVPGTARQDLWLGRQIELSVGTSGNSTYQWEMLDKPPGSAAVLATPTAATSSFTPDLVGTYRIRLVTNGGGAGNVQILALRVRYNNVGALADRGWALPGLGEAGIEENNYDGNTRGYDQVLRYIFADLLPVAGGWNVLKNGSLVGQQRSVNFIGDVPITNNSGQDRIDITLTRYMEIPLVAGVASTNSESPGQSIAQRQINLSLLPSGTKTYYLVATLVSEAVNAECWVELWNVTQNYMVANSQINNTGAADKEIAETFVSAALPQGTTGNTLRTDTNDEYELRVYRTAGLPGDFVSVLNAHLRVVFS